MKRLLRQNTKANAHAHPVFSHLDPKSHVRLSLGDFRQTVGSSSLRDSATMAATVVHSQVANLPSGATTTGPSHITNPNNTAAASKKAGNDEAEPLPATRKFEPSDFQLVRTLGTGTFARVCLVRPASDTSPLEPETSSDQQSQDKDKEKEGKQPEVYALKILRKTEVIKLKQIDHVRHERAILAQVAGHPFITNLLASFADHDSLYMLLDYVAGGELFSYLRKLRRFEERIARFYTAEIVLVLEYLHEQQGGIAYRDLKPENLLLDQEGHIKLVDFGFAKRLGHEGDRPVETYTLCGTPEYLAPEVIQNKGHTTAVDWWALGILLYEFLTGYPPFWHQNPIEIYKQ